MAERSSPPEMTDERLEEEYAKLRLLALGDRDGFFAKLEVSVKRESEGGRVREGQCHSVRSSVRE